MIARGSGKVIFTASLLSFQGGINVPGYTAAKSGIAGLTRALSNEWAPKGVNVNAIAPGYIATDNTQALRDDPDRHRSILERIPAGRWGRAIRPRRRDGVPGLRRLRLRPRHRPAGRRRMARPMSGSPVLDRLGDLGVIPVVVIDDPSRAAALGSALARSAGCRAPRSRSAPTRRSSRYASLAENPDLLVGAGTVLRPAQVEAALRSGRALHRVARLLRVGRQ